MKKSFCIIVVTFLVCSNLSIIAQNANIFVGNAVQNVLFADVENPLIVQVSGVSDTNLKVTCNDAPISQRNGTWYITPSLQNEKNWIDVKVLRKSGDKFVPVETIRFRVRRMPDPIVCVITPSKTYTTGNIPMNEFLNDANRVGLYYERVDLIPPEIESFDVYCSRTSIMCQKDTISPAIKNIVRKAFDEGEDKLTLIIQNVKVSYHTGDSVSIKALRENKIYTICK